MKLGRGQLELVESGKNGMKKHRKGFSREKRRVESGKAESRMESNQFMRPNNST